MSTVIYTKLGETAKGKRLWLEGQRLASQGFSPGMTYRVETQKSRLVIHLDDNGPRRISQKKKGENEYPVIDIESKQLATLFGNASRLRVVIRDKAIYVTLHHFERNENERVARLKERLSRGEPLNIGSLAHGGGVLDHALHAGLNMADVPSRLAFGVECDARYLDASLKNNPIWDKKSIAIHAGMEEIEYDKLPTMEILVAGLPCTGASFSGKAKNRISYAEEHETAGALFVAFLNTISATQPAVILLENVLPYERTLSYLVISQVLETLGYTVSRTDLNGNTMGALENRDRLCMVGVSQGLHIDIAQIAPVRHKEARISEILDPVPLDSPRWKTYDYLRDKEARDKAAGKGFRRQLLAGSEESLGTIGKGYNKARSTEPFIQHPTDPALSRLLTPAEHARAKSSPPELVTGLPDTIAHEILGNSVIHCAFAAVGKHLGESLNACITQHERVAA